MTRQKRSETPDYRWEQELLDAYQDYRWRKVLEPLYREFQQWKAGELDHLAMDEAIHRTQRQNQELFTFFIQKRGWLVRVIQLDETWFKDWVKANPPPPGYKLG